jgi:hypothetical protein
MIHELEPPTDAVTVAVFRREVRHWSKRIGVEVREIRLRSMKRKVASASSEGRLTFDVGLLSASPSYRAQVIIHELVHLKVGNHGPLFRSLVRAHLAETPRRGDSANPSQLTAAAAPAHNNENYRDAEDPVGWPRKT